VMFVAVLAKLKRVLTSGSLRIPERLSSGVDFWA
jgi:hypothetical protein